MAEYKGGLMETDFNRSQPPGGTSLGKSLSAGQVTQSDEDRYKASEFLLRF